MDAVFNIRFDDRIGPRALAIVRHVAFWAAALWILFSPALTQVLGINSIFVRPWIMFSDVGVGILKGEFTVETSSETRSLTPLQLLALDRYPGERHYEFGRRVTEPEDIYDFSQDFCAALEPGASLSFEGLVGTRDGWQVLSVTDLCPAYPEVSNAVPR